MVRKLPKIRTDLSCTMKKSTGYTMNKKFECQPDCGACCVSHGDYEFTFLTEEDIVKMENHLGVSRDEFVMRSVFEWTRSSSGSQFHIRNDGPRCRFLVGKKCGIYEARPVQCRTFPFWPENMPKTAWRALGEFCPGIGKGPELDKKVINQILREQKRADSLCEN